jgi:hypothetical protein
VISHQLEKGERHTKGIERHFTAHERGYRTKGAENESGACFEEKAQKQLSACGKTKSIFLFFTLKQQRSNGSQFFSWLAYVL